MELKTLLSGQTKDVKVEWEGETVLVTFDPNTYTPALEAEVFSQIDAVRGGESAVLVDLLCRLLTSWDIVDKGEPFPIDPEHVSSLPVGFLLTVFFAVGKELGADPLLRGDSDEPS
jgi:hypothetical protein